MTDIFRIAQENGELTLRVKRLNGEHTIGEITDCRIAGDTFLEVDLEKKDVGRITRSLTPGNCPDLPNAIALCRAHFATTRKLRTEEHENWGIF